jgi:hypothetical protein
VALFVNQRVDFDGVPAEGHKTYPSRVQELPLDGLIDRAEAGIRG